MQGDDIFTAVIFDDGIGLAAGSGIGGKMEEILVVIHIFYH
jgi:hypothetical protein